MCLRNSTAQSQYNIAVVGAAAVGKSSLTSRFVQHVFEIEYNPTIEDQHRKQTMIDNQFVVLDILDAGGRKEYAAMREQHYDAAEGFLLVFSLASKSSFDEACLIYKQILRVKDYDNIPIVLVGNMCDQEREVTKGDIDYFIKTTAQRKHFSYMEASAKKMIM